MIYSLRGTHPRFARSVDNAHTGDARTRTASRAERDAAASRVRDLVREEARLFRNPAYAGELAEVRRRIAAYCEDYAGLDDLVASMRRGLGIPAGGAAAA